MSTGSTTLDASQGLYDAEPARPAPDALALVLVWTASEAARLGELLLIDGSAPVIFGRGPESADDCAQRVFLKRQRPGVNELAAPLENPFLSRTQLRIERQGEQLQVTQLGKRPLRYADRETDRVQIGPGDMLEIKGLYAFYCTRRPLQLPPATFDFKVPFGHADCHGIVGESAACWKLREQIAFCAARAAHVLITGESGTGKELVAQAIHQNSPRSHKKMVSRNAATIPSGLIDAELFGNVANYPNAGMPERLGLIGEAHGSTLLLDEIGELRHDLQAHLLRVMDGGDYQRLGEARKRTSDIRFIAATNRSAKDLKHDLLARLALRIDVPGLDDRREDIALLARHLLCETALGDPAIGQRFFSHWNGRSGDPRLNAELVRSLTLHDYVGHARELNALLWQSLSSSRGGFLELCEDMRELQEAPARMRQSPTVTAEDIRQSLARHQGIKDRVWRELGLPSRHALRRLIQKYGIEPEQPDET